MSPPLFLSLSGAFHLLHSVIPPSCTDRPPSIGALTRLHDSFYDHEVKANRPKWHCVDVRLAAVFPVPIPLTAVEGPEGATRRQAAGSMWR